MGTNRDARRGRPFRFFDNAPKGGMIGERQNNTKAGKSRGKISMACDMCGMQYETYAAWAKRYARHYCSVACKAAAMITRVEKHCAVCGTNFFVNHCSQGVIKCCSKECNKSIHLDAKRDTTGKFTKG